MQSPATNVALASQASRLLRSVYSLVWFVVAPLLMACVLVWALSPASGIERPGFFGGLEAFVREQPVPVGIVAFTLFEVAFFGARQWLPLARYANPPTRSDLPASMRRPFEQARVLLEEADLILQRNGRAVERDLSANEREKLKEDLAALRQAMAKQPFDEEAFVEALVRADGEVDVRLGRWRKSEVREYSESIVVAIVVALALRAFVVEAFKIPSGSMIPTLQIGDHIFVNKFVYGPAIPFTEKRVWTSMPPKRGDVIVFAYPEHPEQDFIKRVIALPGDKLEAEDGHPIINGWKVPNCLVGSYSYTEIDAPVQQREGDLFVEYLGDEAYLAFYDHTSMGYGHQGPYHVKQGEVMVMGDNRNNSHDSRMWYGGQGGGVPFANIRGKALFVWLSVPDSGFDWSRMGDPVMGKPRLPAAMRSLDPALDKCMNNRPPLAETTAPPPR